MFGFEKITTTVCKREQVILRHILFNVTTTLIHMYVYYSHYSQYNNERVTITEEDKYQLIIFTSCIMKMLIQ